MPRSGIKYYGLIRLKTDKSSSRQVSNNDTSYKPEKHLES